VEQAFGTAFLGAGGIAENFHYLFQKRSFLEQHNMPEIIVNFARGTEFKLIGQGVPIN
jgi:hypothetical protein